MIQKAISIVVPTYNERENIYELANRIDQSIGENWDYELIVVDDDSPDRTWKKAKELSEFPIRVERRINEKGLTTAVLRGFEIARNNIIFVMDADLQHPPEILPDMIKALENKNDIVVGSRHKKNGSYGEMSMSRTVLSVLGSYIARTLFRETRPVHDVMSGYFGFKKKVIQGKELKPVGFKILLEILIRGEYKNITAVGYRFDARKSGDSKLGLRNSLNYLRHLARLSWREGALGLIAKFCFVGGLGVIVNLLVLTIFTEFGLYYMYSGALAIEAGLLSNFTFNKLWTYKHIQLSSLKNIFGALFRDHLVRSGGMILNLAFLWVLTERFHLYYIFSQVLGIGVATVWNFLGNQWWTWQESVN